jgi:hypothetical protein
MNAYHFSSSTSARRNLFTPIPFALVFVSALLSFSCGTSQTQLLSDASSLEKRLSAKLQPSVKSWIDDQAMKLARFSAEEDGIQEAMGRRFAGQNLSDDGREVLTFLVVARSVDVSKQQTKLFEEHREAIRATTEKMRNLLPKLQADLKRHADLPDLALVPPDCAGYEEEIRKIAELMEKTPSWTTFVAKDAYDMMDFRAVQDDLKGKLDGMNEMTSMRLQMTMDRRSKFISTLSNIMKKISTTQDNLVQNLK